MRRSYAITGTDGLLSCAARTIAAAWVESTGTSMSSLAPDVSSEAACVCCRVWSVFGVVDDDVDGRVELFEFGDEEVAIELPARRRRVVGHEEADGWIIGCAQRRR